MKIVVTAPEAGGPATYANLLKDEFPKRGVDVEVVSFGPVSKYSRFFRTVIYFFILLRSVRGTDIVFAQDPVSTGFPAFLVSRCTGKHFVLRVAGDYAWEQSYQRFGVRDGIDIFQKKCYDMRTEFLRFIQCYVARRADCVIVPSKYFAGVVGTWGVEPSVIYNGLRLGVREKAPSFLVPDKSIVTVGRLVPWKGFEEVIEILSSLTEWNLFIIGDGPEKDNLKAHADDMGVLDRVSFLGRMSREELYGFLKSCSVFVLNTSFESFSFAVAEAMEAGIPIVAGRSGSVPEILREDIDALLISPGNKDELRNAVLRVYNDDELRGSITESARIRVQDFSIDKTLDGLEYIFKTLGV